MRRRQEAAQARRDRLILLGTLGVLGVTAAIVLAGVFLTVYRPPREVVATIDGRKVNAAEVADRATFYMVSEGGAFTQQEGDLAAAGLDRLVRDAVLLRDAPALVGEVSDEDADAKSRELLGNLEGDAYAKALQETLKGADLELAQYREILKARILADRLSEHFRGELPASLRQRHIQRVRTPSMVNAERVIERGSAGEDFEALARQYGADRRLEVDQGWIPDELLQPEAHHALDGLGAGEISAPAMSGLFVDVYRVAEVEEDRPLTEDQQTQLAQRRVDDWVKEREREAGIERDLSDSVSQWITTRVTDRVREAFQAAQAAQSSKSATR